MTYALSMKQLPADWSIAVVGCGGTGSLVADRLCRLLIKDSTRQIILIDHDRVEEHNLRRQEFYEGDVGKYKSQTLAERLARRYGREIGYSILPFKKEFVSGSYINAQAQHTLVNGLLIGCVDNAAARQEIAQASGIYRWWIDAGNGHHSGQVLIGNTENPEMLSMSFKEKDETVVRLPTPSIQLPALLAPAAGELAPSAPDCAQAVEADDQSPVINQAMATLITEFVYRLISGKLSWMGAYLDLEAGSLSTVPADPRTVSKMTGVAVRTLIDKK